MIVLSGGAGRLMGHLGCFIPSAFVAKAVQLYQEGQAQVPLALPEANTFLMSFGISEKHYEVSCSSFYALVDVTHCSSSLFTISLVSAFAFF